MFNWYNFVETVLQSRLPFKITIEPLAEFRSLEDGFKYPCTGIKIVFRRNNLGVLAGGFYFPTLAFSLLSLLSFAIKPEVVSYCIILLIQFYICLLYLEVPKSILGSWAYWFTKGQLISKCLFEKIVWTKIPTKNLIDSAQQV